MSTFTQSLPSPSQGLSQGQGQGHSGPSPSDSVNKSGGPSPSQKADTIKKIIDAARSQIGIPYNYGGGGTNGPSMGSSWPAPGFDCSGLMQYAFAKGGIPLPRTSEADYAKGPTAPGPSPGVLIYFDGKPPGHVALITERSTMIEAAHTGTNVREVPIRTQGLTGYTDPAGSGPAGSQDAGGLLGGLANDLIPGWAKGLIDAVNEISKLIGDIMNPDMLKRIGKVVLGAIILGAGVGALFSKGGLGGAIKSAGQAGSKVGSKVGSKIGPSKAAQNAGEMARAGKLASAAEVA